MRPAILFDLDGTLIDSIELILGAARHAFLGFEGRAPSDEEWRAGIGRPLQDHANGILGTGIRHRPHAE